MNIGLKHCTGEIIGILNSDDIFKNTLKIVAKYFNKTKIDYLFWKCLQKQSLS